MNLSRGLWRSWVAISLLWGIVTILVGMTTYHAYVWETAPYCPDSTLSNKDYRCKHEVWLINLSDIELISSHPQFSSENKAFIEDIVQCYNRSKDDQGFVDPFDCLLFPTSIDKSNYKEVLRLKHDALEANAEGLSVDEFVKARENRNRIGNRTQILISFSNTFFLWLLPVLALLLLGILFLWVLRGFSDKNNNA